MKVTVVGYEVMKYTSKKTGELVSGIRLFFMGQNPNVKGMMTDSAWINEDRNPEVYRQIFALDVQKPIFCDLVYEQVVGSKFLDLKSVKPIGQ